MHFKKHLRILKKMEVELNKQLNARCQIKMNSYLFERIKERIKKEGISRSEFLRKIIFEYLEKRKEKEFFTENTNKKINQILEIVKKL